MMLNPLFSFEEYGSDANYHPRGFINESSIKPAHVFLPAEDEDMGSGGGAVDDLWPSYGFHPGSPLGKAAPVTGVPNNQQCFQDLMAIDDANFHAISDSMQMLEMPAAALEGAPDRSVIPEISELLSPKENSSPTSFSLLELASNHKLNYNHFNGERISSSSDKEVKRTGNELSTEEVIRIAAAHFIQLSSPKDGDPSIQRLPFGISLSSLTVEEIKNVELASFLLAAAGKVANQQYERAGNLLRQCYMLSSTTGNPVERVVCYFSDALQERIARETGRLKAQKARGALTAEEVIKAMLQNHPLQLVCHKTLPFSQVLQFTSMQALIDNVANAKRVHMIDLSIKHGLGWTILIQALATRSTCPVESLKISAVGLAEEIIVPTGKRLSRFAEGLGILFEFKAVVVPDMKDLREAMFELREGEVVGICSHMDMSTMIVRPETLENVMRVIWKLKPCVMAVIDVEAKHNSPSFINRFIEALFYFSALFDCMDGAMERSDTNRMGLEGDFFSQGIMSIVATEGKERVVRHVGISVWREFFARFGLVEVDLNEYSLYQASLILKQYVNGDFCTLEMDGKSLLTGWKGTPMHFVSAWKFKNREGNPHYTRPIQPKENVNS